MWRKVMITIKDPYYTSVLPMVSVGTKGVCKCVETSWFKKPKERYAIMRCEADLRGNKCWVVLQVVNTVSEALSEMNKD